jgi:hypothetical protein
VSRLQASTDSRPLVALGTNPSPSATDTSGFMTPSTYLSRRSLAARPHRHVSQSRLWRSCADTMPMRFS